MKILLHSLFLIVLGAFLYGHTLHVPFQLDDYGTFVLNPVLKHWPDMRLVWDYEPLRFIPHLSFAANYASHGLNLSGFHVVNIAIHILNALLVFCLSAMLLKKAGPERGIPPASVQPIAFLAALIFLTHPVQTSAVTYIVQRITSLAAFFYLVSLAAYVRFRTRGGRVYYGLALAAAVLGVLSKEFTVTLPLSLCLLEFGVLGSTGEGKKRRLWMLAPFFLLMPGLVALHFWGSPPKNLQDFLTLTRLTEDYSRSEYFFTQIRVMLTYLRIVLVPLGQQLEYDYPVYSRFTDPPVFISFLIVAAVLAWAVGLWRRHRMVSVGIFFYFLCLLPDSSFIVLPDVIFEHRLYLPMAGAALSWAVMLGVWVGPVRRRAASFLLVALLSYLAYQRNADWTDPVVFLEKNVRASPRNERIYLNLGNFYNQEGDTIRAEQNYLTVVRLNPKNDQAHNNLALLYYNMGARELAREYAQKTLALKPELGRPYFYLGRMAFEENDPVKAEDNYRKAIEREPDFAYPYMGLAMIYAAAQDEKKTLEYGEKSVWLNPDDTGLRYQLGNLYFQFKKWDEARDAYLASFKIEPRNLAACNNLAITYYVLKDYAAAEKYFMKILAADPNSGKTYFNLANVYHAMGQVEKAEEFHQKSLSLSAKYGLGKILNEPKDLDQTEPLPDL